MEHGHDVVEIPKPEPTAETPDRPYRRGRSARVWHWTASSGMALVVLATMHIVAQHFVVHQKGGLIANNYRAGLKEAFGVQAMNTVEGYIHAEMFSLIVPLAMGYFAIRAVAGATVGAEERGHLDTALALPVSRTVLMMGAYLVAAVVCAAIMAVTGAMTFIVGRVAGSDISLRLVTSGVMGVLPLAMFFGGVAALASRAAQLAHGEWARARRTGGHTQSTSPAVSRML